MPARPSSLNLEQEAATGLAPVTGPGTIVRLADAPAPIDPNTGRASGGNVSRVLDVDLQGRTGCGPAAPRRSPSTGSG